MKWGERHLPPTTKIVEIRRRRRTMTDFSKVHSPPWLLGRCFFVQRTRTNKESQRDSEEEKSFLGTEATTLLISLKHPVDGEWRMANFIFGTLKSYFRSIFYGTLSHSLDILIWWLRFIRGRAAASLDQLWLRGGDSSDFNMAMMVYCVCNWKLRQYRSTEVSVT